MPEYLTDNKEQIITSISYEDSAEGKPRGVIKYVQTAQIEEAIAQMPEALSRTRHFDEAMVLVKRAAASVEGGATEVTLTYEPLADAEGDDAEPTYKLDSSAADVSILLHPIFAAVPETEKLLAKALLDGTNPGATVALTADASGAPVVKADEKSTLTLTAAIAKNVTTDAGKLLIEKIRAGTKEYLEPRHTWTETKYASSLASNTRRLGKIETPPGDAPGGSWILDKVTAEKTKSGKKWKIVSTWKCAAPDSAWDKDLYK